MDVEMKSPSEEMRLSVVENLSQQARVFAAGAAQNLMQLGRVFCEARPLFKKGGWEAWVEANTGMSARTAQNLMGAYRRYGAMPELQGIEKSKVFAMLALPDGTETAFVETHDLNGMTAREVKDEVARVREEMQKKLDAEQAAHEATKKQLNMETDLRQKAQDSEFEKQQEIEGLKDALEEAQSRPVEAEPPQAMVDELNMTKAALDSAKETAQSCIDDRNNAEKERAEAEKERDEARRDRDEMEELLRQSQEECQRIQNDLLNLQSQNARGDAERDVSEGLTSEELARAVSAFMAVAAQMPFMAVTFASMRGNEYDRYREALDTVEDWCKRSRRALETYTESGAAV